jgi:polyisoprenyl-phosphate glycosyltransferase
MNAERGTTTEGVNASRFSVHSSSFILSVVVPCYNEEPVIRETHRRLAATLSEQLPAGARFEIVYVDDGSRDQTPEILRELADGDARVRVIRLSRNFGHQIAFTAGLEHSRGDAVVVIDADLQDPPEVIPEMVAAWREGADVAYGERTERVGETHFKLWTAKLFYRLINRISKVQIPLDTGDFRLMDRRVVDALLSMPERDRFIRGMVAWVGYKQVPVKYARAARFAGTSKYPLFKMLRFAMDGVLSFSFAPLRLAVWTGFAAIGVAFGGIVYALILRFFFDESHWVRGWTSLFVATLFLGGVQLLSLGIIGEYIGRIYGEVKNRPLYFVRERLGFGAEEDSENITEHHQYEAQIRNG